MILGSSVWGQAFSSFPLLVFGVEDTPFSFSFGFYLWTSFSAFPLTPLHGFSKPPALLLQGWCVLCDLPSASGHFLSTSSLLMAVSCCKAASGFGLQPFPQLSFFPPLMHRDNGGILAGTSFSSCTTHHHQPLPCARDAVPGVSAKARVPLCPSSFNLNTDKFSWPQRSFIS